MSWSFHEYTLAEVKDMTLPCVVKIAEGYHGEGESESFSRDDIIKIDEFAVLQKVVANFVSDYQGNKAFYQDEIQIPLNYNGKLKVIHPPKEYSTVAELSENPPRYAKILEPAKTPIAYKGGGTVIPPGTIIEIDRVLPKIKGNEKTLLVTVNKNTIQLPLSLKLKASAVPDENEYTMKEVIDRFGLPRTIKFLDNKVQEVFERNLRGGVENMSRITGTLRLKRLVKQEVLIGHYKGLEYSDDASTTTVRRSVVVIPLTEFAETSVQIREEENHHDYEIFVASNFSQSQGCKFVDGSLYAEFTRKPTVYKIPEEIEEATEEEKNKDASLDYEECGPPRHRPPPSLPPRPGNQNPAPLTSYRNMQGPSLTKQTPTQSTRGQTHEQPRRPLPTPPRPTPNTPTSHSPGKFDTVPPHVPLKHRHDGDHQSINRFDISPKPHNLTPLQDQTKDTENDCVYEIMAPMADYVKLQQPGTTEFALPPRTKASGEDSYTTTPATGKGYVNAKSFGGKFVSWFQKKPKSKDPKAGKRHISFDDECKTTADTTDENDDYELPVVKGTKGTDDYSDDAHYYDEPEEIAAMSYRQKPHRQVNVEDDTDPHHPISNIPMATVQPVPNAHKHMGGKVKTVEELSVTELEERLGLCGLEKFAEVCKEQRLDGNFLVMLDKDKDMLKSAPFSLTNFDICKLERMISKTWIPNDG